MKGKRQITQIKDFSGGQNTLPSQVNMDTKYSPDCLNVYAEGQSLRQRLGISSLTSFIGTTGNGFYNWVQSANAQFLMFFFDSTLKRMGLSGNSWSGTVDTISKDSANGSAFSNAIMHFVTYQGTLIMTTENRDKPQRMTVSDGSYKNLDYGGTGTAPFGKYPQVWKEHVWLLNIGNGGGQLSEDGTTISAWTNNDVGTGSSSSTTFGGFTTFRLHAGSVASDDAHLTKSISGGLVPNYVAEIKADFTTLGAVTSNDYAWMDIYNGTIRFRTRWSSDGLEIYDGAAWKEVAVNTVNVGTWNAWKFVVTGGTATSAYVDIYKDNTAIGLQYIVNNASTASNGQVDIVASAGASSNRADWYMDYININSTIAKQNYYTDGVYNNWITSSRSSNTDTVLPSQPLMHYRCNDNASDSIVTDSGSGAANGASYNSAGTINTSTLNSAGKISDAFVFSVASSQHLRSAAATVTALSVDSTGSICMWVNPNSLSTYAALFTMSNSSENKYIRVAASTSGQVEVFGIAGTATFTVTSPTNTLAVGTWTHIIVTKDSAVNILINSATVTNTVSGSSFIWASSISSLDAVTVANLRYLNLLDVSFDGRIDDIRYYRTTLTSADAQAIYGEGNGTEGNPVTVQEATTVYTGTYSYRVNQGTGTYAVVSQTLSSGTGITGTPCIFGQWCNITNNVNYKLRVNDGTNNYDSALFLGNGTWQYQILPFTAMSNATALKAQTIMLGSGTMYIDQSAIITSDINATITDDHSDRLQRSVSGTYDTWTGSDSGTNDITTPGDVGLTGSFILQDRMYVTKAWSIHRITYTGSTPLLDIKQVRSTVGTKSPRSVKNIDVPGKGELVIFLGTDRILYLFDGFSSQPITENIQLDNGISPVCFNNINTQALDKVFAINHTNLGWYEIFLPLNGSSTPNYSVVYDYWHNSFWPFSNRGFSSGDIADNGSGQRVAYALSSSNGIGYLLNDTTSDNGTAISSKWTSFKLGEGTIIEKDDEVDIAMDSTSITPTFSFRTNYEENYTAVHLTANKNKYNFSPKRNANLIQFKITNSNIGQTFKLWCITIINRMLGHGE